MKYQILTGLCIFAILYIVLKPNYEETYQNLDTKSKKPDNLFTDGLDHSYGIKKQHRHHSF